MAYLTDKQEILEAYEAAKKEAKEWKRDYDEFERLADNGIIDSLDDALPEVNDGSLAAALFKLPKRVVNSKLTGRPKAIDRDDAWLSELAKMQWENNIVKNANSQAPFHRKWKDAVRKAAIYGGIPLVTLFVERGSYTGSDFIVASAYDVTLEAGKVSDYDSDIIFWDIYLSDLQLANMIEQAEKETKEAKESEEDGYNKWNVKLLKEIQAGKAKEDRPGDEIEDERSERAVERGGVHFYIAFQRGVEAPFYMCHKDYDGVAREWSNPDPTGDLPVHYLYAYQDFINPYGIGIVKLAGGTQNVLDYMRQSDVLATQLGLRPPKLIAGDTDDVDEESLVYAEDANWFVGNAQLQRMELGNGVYAQLPNRISMYKTSLNQLIPTGDTSIGAAAGDPSYSKTPAGVKFQAASLSIDDDDFKDNLYITYEAKAKSMINYQFANMQGTDLMKLTDEEKEVLMRAGLEFPEDTNELEIQWDKARASFDFEVEAETDKETEEKERLEGLFRVAELRQADPIFDQRLMQAGARLNDGKLYKAAIALITDEDIIEDIAPEEQAALGGELVPGEELAVGGEEAPPEGMEEAVATIQAVSQQYGVDEQIAAAALEAERQGQPIDSIVAELQGAQSAR